MNDMQDWDANPPLFRINSADARRFSNDIQDMADTLRPVGRQGRTNDELVIKVLSVHLNEVRHLLAAYLTTGDPDPLMAGLTEQKEYPDYNPVLWVQVDEEEEKQPF
jgi:hypothetical protein